jgi:hypothetical protein
MLTRSPMLKGRATARTLLCAMLALPLCACVTASVVPNSVSCAALLPQEWKKGVDSAELRDPDTIGGWIAFADAQTGRLDMANARTSDAIGIVERCEARDAQAVNHAKRGFFGRLFG